MSAPPLPPRAPPRKPPPPAKPVVNLNDPPPPPPALPPRGALGAAPAPPPRLPPREVKGPPMKPVPQRPPPSHSLNTLPAPPPPKKYQNPPVSRTLPPPSRPLPQPGQPAVPPPPGRPLPSKPVVPLAPPPSRPVPSKPVPSAPAKQNEAQKGPMVPSKVPDTSVWGGRFTFRGNLPPPPRYSHCPKMYVSGNKSAKCPQIGEIVKVSEGPSPEVAKAAERDKKMAALQKEIEAAGKQGDMKTVMELSKKMKVLAASLVAHFNVYCNDTTKRFQEEVWITGNVMVER
eukprot:CAMPEP_0184490080 /NCGR_PEP_ID=MMETSP0113_2-20130426/17089_1 /TAXON_ID=91329 /ORGANISM="Norrisiella sphaerica, Strain BC52" /LENGTH=286 /DNA_ID=CAMNT_0026873819 /DNA_START=140 /DNA_END=999 /DNA_ORIENTATION=+